MFYIYLLKDERGKLYTGYTKDLKRRLNEHLRGKTPTTRKMVSPKLFYYEAYDTEKAARIREGKLKQHGSSYQGLIKRIT